MLVGGTSRAILFEFPRTHWKLEQVVQDHFILWVCREKWAKQLVQAVSGIHSRDLVIGELSGSFSPVLIEGLDCIQFWKFRKAFEPGRRKFCHYPPESFNLLRASPIMCEAENPVLTSKTDLFHLGFLLWLLAENVPLSHAHPLCVREGGNREGDSRPIDSTWRLVLFQTCRKTFLNITRLLSRTFEP